MPHVRWSDRIVTCLSMAAVCVTGCGGSEGSLTEPPKPLPAEVILVAGNIATCGTANDEATAAVLDTLAGTIFTLGDNAFPNGSAEAYRDCYGPSWGRYKARTYATLGNHEYNSGSATASFEYFGDRLGPGDRGYYSLDLGNWHIVVLNINDFTVNDTKPFLGSPQEKWLKADLAAHSKTCTLALWHNPRFFSSNEPNWTRNEYIAGLWDQLYVAGVDLVLNGQQHQYERFAPMAPTGTIDQTRGIREFNVGTGGESIEMPTILAENREKLIDAFGVLKLTLDADSYRWEFVPVVPDQFSDTGSGTCH